MAEKVKGPSRKAILIFLNACNAPPKLPSQLFCLHPQNTAVSLNHNGELLARWLLQNHNRLS